MTLRLMLFNQTSEMVDVSKLVIVRSGKPVAGQMDQYFSIL